MAKAAAKKTTKKSASKTKKPASKKGGRCWEGYEPVPGKEPGSKGSCRKAD